jgi:arylsulfatase A-like enzyme
MFKSMLPLRRSAPFAALLLAACGRPASVPPNLVLVVIDTARADHFSCYGYALPTTPHVDALAARGVRFTEARSVAPWTLPAHMSMFSGLPPRDHGATWAAFSEPAEAPLRELVARAFEPGEPERMLAARLGAAGYETHGFSPNPWVARSKGLATGFDEFHELWRAEERAAFAADVPSDALSSSLSGVTMAGVRRALAERDEARPFFLFVNFLDPHFPYEPPEPYRARLGGTSATVTAIQAGGRRSELAMIAGAAPFTPAELVPLYDGELATADHFVGELVAALERADVLDDTLVVVTSDHGELLGERGQWSHQLSVGEELLHVPLVLKLPHDARAGTVRDDPLVSNLDVYATLLAAAGLVPPPGLARDLLAPVAPPRALLVAEYDTSRAYLRQLAEVHPPFDPEAHFRELHALYTPDLCTRFAAREPELDGARRADVQPAPDAMERAREALRAYLAARDPRGAGRAGKTAEDASTGQELEDLGYVGGEDDAPR